MPLMIWEPQISMSLPPRVGWNVDKKSVCLFFGICCISGFEMSRLFRSLILVGIIKSFPAWPRSTESSTMSAIFMSASKAIFSTPHQFLCFSLLGSFSWACSDTSSQFTFCWLDVRPKSTLHLHYPQVHLLHMLSKMMKVAVFSIIWMICLYLHLILPTETTLLNTR